ncbi:hypothetical protein D3C73_1477150 [compost metagenome]
MAQARIKPPSTRITVIPMSVVKSKSVNSRMPSCTMLAGLARNVGETRPVKVTSAQTAKNSTKKQNPRNHRRREATGRKGTIIGLCQTFLLTGNGAGSRKAG